MGGPRWTMAAMASRVDELQLNLRRVARAADPPRPENPAAPCGRLEAGQGAIWRLEISPNTGAHRLACPEPP